MTTGITPTAIFPLQYPKGDPTLPERGAKAVSQELNWSADSQFTVSLLQMQQQNFFGSLRCIWIDCTDVDVPCTVAVNGTEQVFIVPANTSNYYAVINLNVPVVSFSIGAETAAVTRVLFLNFVPSIAMQNALSFSGAITVSGTVAVSNFPATQNVDIVASETLPVALVSVGGPVPVSQSGSWAVSASGSFPVTGTFWQATQPVSIASTVNVDVTNFPAIQPISGTVSVSNFPATYPVTGTFWQATQPVSIAASVAVTGTFFQATQPVSLAVLPALAAGANVIGSTLPAPEQATGYLSIAITANTSFAVTSGTAITASTKIRGIIIDLVGYTNAGASNFRIFDGSNNQVYQHTFPAVGVSSTQYGVVVLDNLNLTLNNGGVAPYCNLSAAAATGYVGVSLFVS
jgi:hypothetical protein